MVLVVAAALTTGFTVLFGWLAAKAVRSGAVFGIGSSQSRVRHPLLFWAGVTAWTLNAFVGACFTTVLLYAVVR